MREKKRRKDATHSRAEHRPIASKPAQAPADAEAGPGAPEPRGASLLALAGLAILVLALFRGVLWQSSRILGALETDMAGQFLAWRSFGFLQMAKGHFPLWNPYIYGGEPFFGGMQSALLYPPNALFLALPISVALNWSVALNMWLMGAFMFAWARGRGLSAMSSFFAGATMMFCGAYATHVYAGHLPNLCTMPWAPLTFLAIDGWLDRRRLAWLLLGMGAVAMQILAGHMQYAIYTAIAAGFYSLTRLMQSPRKASAALGLLAIYPGGAALAGVQLLTAMEAASESVRNAALPWEFVASYSFPPENFMTLLVPRFFGLPKTYWGQCYMWEMTFFVGLSGLALAVLAATRREHRRAWPLLATLAAMVLLALGRHTPLLWLLYKHVPGFNMFRGLSKFIFQASLCLAMLAAMGLESFRRRATPPRALAIGAVVLALAMAIGSAAPSAQWESLMRAVSRLPEGFNVPQGPIPPAMASRAQSEASGGLMVGAASCACLAVLLALRKRWPGAPWAVLALGVGETLAFANAIVVTFSPDELSITQVQKVIQSHHDDQRVLFPLHPNNAMLLQAENVLGNDPYVLRRYAEFVTWSQGGDPDKATQYFDFARDAPSLALLRLRYVYELRDFALHEAVTSRPIMPRAFLVGHWRLEASGRDAIFGAMAEKAYNPWREAILERDPGLGASGPDDAPAIAEVDRTLGRAQVVAKTTDSLTIEADVSRPAILAIGDAWAKGWRARALPGSSQSHYEVMPVNYWMRGVPLAPGRHKLIVEYAPRSFVVGAWVTTIAGIAYAMAWGLALWRFPEWPGLSARPRQDRRGRRAQAAREASA